MHTHGRRIAVLGVFANLDESYSVAGVALQHLRLLTSRGHEVVFITTTDFTDADRLPPGVSIKMYPRHTKPWDRTSRDELLGYAGETSKLLVSALEGCDTCITHDVIFLRDYLPVNWAMRFAASNAPWVRWLHWMHSAPSDRPQGTDLDFPISACYSGMENSRYVYVNRVDIPRVAKMFDVPEGHVHVVHNIFDPCSAYSFHPLSRELYDRLSLWSADVVCTYPTRTTEAKQIDKLIKLAGYLKGLGNRVRFIVCNSYSGGEAEVALVRSLVGQLESVGLGGGEFIFTSELASSWASDAGYDLKSGVPHQVVLDLLKMSDVFVLPSVSEGCSIIMLEAAFSRNLVILNKDVHSMHEFGGQPMTNHSSGRCMYFSFGSLTRPITRYLPDEHTFYSDHARLLLDMVREDRALQFFKHVRKHHSPQWVYDNHIAPLLDWAEGC